MSMLSQFTGGGGGGGGSSSIGDIKQVMFGNVRQTLQSNSITDVGGGVWIRVGQVYQQNTYPNLFARIGFVNANIGITRLIQGNTIGNVTGAIAYSGDDDLYVFPTWNTSGNGQLVFSNSSLIEFTYKNSGTGFVNAAAYGGDGGNQRFILVSNTGVQTVYPSNQTVGTHNTSVAGLTNVISGNANTFLLWTSANGNVRISTNSGARWGNSNSNTLSVTDIVWANIGGANGMYLMTGSGSGIGPAWVETSTDAIRWTGISPETVTATGRTNRHLALGTANIYVSTFVEANNSANTAQGQTYTSTDGRHWEYRGLLPYNSGSNNIYGVGGSGRITAVGNGANTLIASSDWFHQVTQQTGQHCYPIGHHYQACHDWWNGSFHYYACFPQQAHQCETSYSYSLTTTKHNRIYTANATVTNTPSLNIYSAFANAVSAHNNHIIHSFAFGYANNATYYVYGTSNGNVASSTDGFNWSDRNYSITGNANLNIILYGTANSTNLFMFAGNNGIISTSENLVTYTARTTAYSLDTSGWWTGAFGNANGQLLYVLGGNTGNLVISNNGIQFSGMNTMANVNGVAFGNNRFVAALPNGVCKFSTDGIYWSNTGSITGAANDVYAVATDNVKFVYAAQGGRVGYLFDVTGAWTNSTISSSNDHYALTYGGGLWVLGGREGSLFTSTDGVTWTFRTSNTRKTILTTMYANNTYFYGGDNVLATSTDAVTWITRNPNSAYVRISALGYGGANNTSNVYVYGAQGFFGTSTDGITWTTVPAGPTDQSNTSAGNTTYTGQINEITTANIAGNIVIIAVGDTGFVETSNNGTIWVTQNAKTGNDFTSIAFGNNRFLAVGERGVAKISPNGVLWSGHASNANVFSIAYYQNTVNSFVLVGAARYANLSNLATGGALGPNASNSNLSFILETSNDGIYWTTRQWKTPLPPGFAAGGNVAALIQDINFNPFSNETTNMPFSQNGRGFSFQSRGRVSVSNNLTTWSGPGISSTGGNTDIGTGINAGVPGISAGNGRFFATGLFGVVASSNDGIYWVESNIFSQFMSTAAYDLPLISIGASAQGNVSYAAFGMIAPYNRANFHGGPGGSLQPVSLSTNSASKLIYHGTSKVYMLPVVSSATSYGGLGSMMFTSQDLITWHPRLSFGRPTDASGPVVIRAFESTPFFQGQSPSPGNNYIVFTANANNYVSAAYDTTKEFYVPRIFPYSVTGANLTPSLNAAAYNAGTQAQITGDNIELIWYVKAED